MVPPIVHPQYGIPAPVPPNHLYNPNAYFNPVVPPVPFVHPPPMVIGPPPYHPLQSTPAQLIPALLYHLQTIHPVIPHTVPRVQMFHHYLVHYMIVMKLH